MVVTDGAVLRRNSCQICLQVTHAAMQPGRLARKLQQAANKGDLYGLTLVGATSLRLAWQASWCCHTRQLYRIAAKRDRHCHASVAGEFTSSLPWKARWPLKHLQLQCYGFPARNATRCIQLQELGGGSLAQRRCEVHEHSCTKPSRELGKEWSLTLLVELQ